MKPVKTVTHDKSFESNRGTLDLDPPAARSTEKALDVHQLLPLTTAGELPGRLRILLADDSPVSRMIAMRLLERRGHAVITASNGRQAVEALLTNSVDLVLMDMNMPEMDGLQATQAIRRNAASSGARVPIIALTGSDQEFHKQACLDAGMDGFLTKPILVKALDEILSRFRPVP